MSGFEVIGVVLGVWPVVTNALYVYKAAKGGLGRDLLLHEAKTEEIIFTEFVKHLLASDVSEADLLSLSNKKNPNLALWRDKELNAKLERRLGREKSDVVLKTIQLMGALLTSVNDQLGGQEQAVIQDSQSRKLRHAFRNVKHQLPNSSLRQDLEALHSYNGQLRRLLSSSTSSNSTAQGTSPVQILTSSPEVLRRISNHANDLHDAICNGYRCQCPLTHQASLGLQSRLRQAPSNTLDATEPFELLFPLDESVGHHIHEDIEELRSLRNMSIDTSHEPFFPSDTSQASTYNTSWSPRNSISFPTLSPTNSSPPPREQRGRSISFSESKDEQDGGLIDDLCNFIKTLSDKAALSAPPSSLGILGQGQRKYVVQVTSLDGNSSDHQSVVCLDDCLIPNQKWELSRKNRMDLALSLSLAILQFFSTPWIDSWWTWKDFCMLKDDKSQIFVTKRFYSAHSPLNPSNKGSAHSLPMSTFWACFGEPELTRLGFALIELALGKRLSELRDQSIDHVYEQDMLDLKTAKDMIDTGALLEEAGQCYHDVVKVCLEHQVIMSSGVKGLNSKHVDFQLDLERYVVAPIRDLYNTSWGRDNGIL